jgi:hypothetical protein
MPASVPMTATDYLSLIFTITLLVDYYYPTLLTDEKTQTQRASNFSRVTYSVWLVTLVVRVPV